MNTSCTHPTRYATDLTDAEWDVVAPYVNADPAIGSPRAVCMRCVVNALFYIDTTGCQWQMLPGDLPNYGTVALPLSPLERGRYVGTHEHRVAPHAAGAVWA